ncbi:MAG TPA: J domain-containing protein [Vicinamibacteria bacterium]|nr:J domain-containing protein [Vicinamibacteria bacterium]
MISSGDYYTLLGVKSNASKAAIRRAFQKLARKYHPDLNPGDSVAAVRYRRLYEAFEILIDTERRERYDTHGSRPSEETREEPPRYGFAGFDFSLEGEKGPDIFPELFQSSLAPEPGRRERGDDIHHRLALRFEDTLTGLETSFQIVRSHTCGTCQGFGDIPSADPVPCTACSGRGRAMKVHGFMIFAKPCASCGGTGHLARELCPECRGAGCTSRPETVTLLVPRGVSDGDKLLVPSRGHEGRGAGAPGDLYVDVHVQSHPLFSRQGDNLFCTVALSFAEAALGARIEVPTPDGPVTLRVPAGVQSGQKLRISGRGAPSRRADARGDLFIVVKVVTPTVYDDRSRELLRELDRLNPLGPRNPRSSEVSEVSS